MAEDSNHAAVAETPAPSAAAGARDEFTFDKQVTEGLTFKEQIRRPVNIAKIILTLGVLGLIAYLNSGRVYVDLPPPEISYELLPNQGLTEGVPIAIKINQVAVFKISDPMQGGSATRARDIVANLEGAVADLREQPGRTITLETEGEFPAIVQSAIDGTGKRLLVQIEKDDVTLSRQDDSKWVARAWAERVTDALKLFMFGEPPVFTEGTPFGNSLLTMYDRALQARGAVSGGALNDAYKDLNDVQQLALADFPPPEEPAEGTPGVTP